MSVGGRLGTSQTQDLVLLAALGVGAYVLYNVFAGIKKTAAAADAIVQAAAAAGQQVQDSVVAGLAKIYTAATLPPAIIPTGSVRLPNGAVIAASQINQLTFDSSQNAAFFSYMGIDYQIAPQHWDAQGNLIATEVIDFGVTQTGGWS